ncbi:MAG: RipA family octameric membrane protein [Polynucleobacter sp.]
MKIFNEPDIGTPYSLDEKWRSDLLEQYKLYVDLADRISARRAASNSYFVSLNTAILGFIGYLTIKDSSDYVWAVAGGGILLSILWESLITSYRSLNSAKFEVIHAVEKKLPANLFREEWRLIGEGKNRVLYWPVSHIEQKVPYVFMALHLIVFCKSFPWRQTLEWVGQFRNFFSIVT